MKCLVLAMMISCIAFLPPGSAEPPCHLQELASCVNIAVEFINSLERRSLAQTNEDMDRFCKATNETFACFRDYMRRCMTPIQTGLLYLVADGLVALNRELCESASSPVREEFLGHAECLNRVAQAEETSENIQYFFAVIEGFTSLPNSQRINYLCCGYNKMYNSIKSEALSTCGEEATKAGEEFISLAVSELPSLLCTGFDAKSEDCNAVLPPDGAKPTEGFKGNPIYAFAFRILKNYVK